MSCDENIKIVEFFYLFCDRFVLRRSYLFNWVLCKSLQSFYNLINILNSPRTVTFCSLEKFDLRTSNQWCPWF